MGFREILLVAERDILALRGREVFIVMRWVWYFIQVAVFGLALSALTGIKWYSDYYATGVYVVTLYSASITIAYEIMEEADTGTVDYLLSLPISRRDMELGRSIGGAVRGLIISFFPFVTTLYLVGSLNPYMAVYALVSVFLFSFGVSGLGILIVSGLKSTDKSDIVIGVLNAFIARLSTVFYPFKAIVKSNPVYAGATLGNPLSYLSEILRMTFNVPTGFEVNPAMAIAIILLFTLTMEFLGTYFYEKRIEGGGWT